MFIVIIAMFGVKINVCAFQHHTSPGSSDVHKQSCIQSVLNRQSNPHSSRRIVFQTDTMSLEQPHINNALSPPKFFILEAMCK